MELIIIFVLVGLSSWALSLYFSSPSSSFYILDEPNQRSLHSISKPKSGGLGIFFSLVLGWVIVNFIFGHNVHFYYFFIALLLLVGISFLDDRNSLLQIYRLIVHFISATLMLTGIHLATQQFVNLNYIFLFILIVCIVWCINLYNFMDGIDGLAAGMAIIGFASYGIMGWVKEDTYYLVMCIVIVAANTGFIITNFPPSKIFMGDVGSTMLGFLVAYYSMLGVERDIFSWWVPIVVFSPFIVDTTITLIYRLIIGEKFWRAHKNHFYQKLVRIGWSHYKTIKYEYILMFLTSISAILIQLYPNKSYIILVILFWMLTYFIIIFKITQQWNKFNKG